MKDKSFVKESPQNKSKSIVVGLDIGTTKIACFVGVKNEHGKIEIISMGKSKSLGVKKGVVFNMKKTVMSIEKAILDTQKNVKDGDLVLKHVIGAPTSRWRHLAQHCRRRSSAVFRTDRVLRQFSRRSCPYLTVEMNKAHTQ